MSNASAPEKHPAVAAWEALPEFYKQHPALQPLAKAIAQGPQTDASRPLSRISTSVGNLTVSRTVYGVPMARVILDDGSTSVEWMGDVRPVDGLVLYALPVDEQ